MCLITGKARSWSEGSHWLWQENDLQGVGEQWLSRFTCEKTKPLFPQCRLLAQEHSSSHICSIQREQEGSRPSLQTCFSFPPSLLWVSVHPRDVGSSMNAQLSPEQARGCPVQVSGLTQVRGQQWDSCPCLALPPAGTSWAPQGLGRSQRRKFLALTPFRGTLGVYKWDSELPYRQNPCSPETRPS